MPKALRLSLAYLLLVPSLLAGCGTSSSAMRPWEDAAQDNDAASCDTPGADQCIVLACNGEEGLCGVFSCEDIDPEALAQVPLSHGIEPTLGGAFRPPMHGPVPFRNWRTLGLRQGARPRMTFHFRYRFGYLPAFPRYEGRVIKHHLFPQAREFREWFRRSPIDVHQYTLLIPEHIHLQIHRGDGRGGLWNAAWREYMRANPVPPKPDVLLRHSLDLAIRYGLTGPIMPYSRPVVPIGPQLYQN